MPKIPVYNRQYTVPGGSGNTLMDVGSAGQVGNAITKLGNTGLAVTTEFADLLSKQREKLERQANDNALIEDGAKVNDEYLNYVTNEKNTRKGSESAGSMKRAEEFTQGLLKKYQRAGNEYFNTRIKNHILAQDHSAKNHLAAYEAGEQKAYSVNVRTLDLETSKKMAQSGDFSTASVNYAKTLKAQLDNKTITPEEHGILLVQGNNEIAASFIIGLVSKDPISAKTAFEALKGQMLTADTAANLEKIVKPAESMRRGIDAGVKIFKEDTTGSIEQMTDKLRSLKLDPETEETATGKIKELYNERKLDEENKRKDVIKKTNDILAEIALKRNGLNRPSDLTPSQWAELRAVDPEYAANRIDKMRRELEHEARLDKAEKREAEKEMRLKYAENESTILIADDFASRDLKQDLAKGNILPSQYTRLLNAQQKLDPVKRDSVRSALSKVNSGSALANALNVKDKSEEAIWKLKYGDLVKAWAYNHADDPDFDRKMTEFIERQVLSDMVTSWFSGDESDRLEKFQKAKTESGERPQRRKKTVEMDNMPPADGNNGRIIKDTQTGKRWKSNGKEWVEVQ